MKRILLNQATTYPEYSEISPSRFRKVPHDAPDEFLKMDEVGELIFAPDPRTGIPRSDLALIMSNSARPEVAEYIRQTLQRPLPDSERSVNADDALRFTKSPRESLESYGDRLRAICSEAYEKERNLKSTPNAD